MLSKLIAGSALVLAAAGVVSVSDLSASGPAQAYPVCASAGTTGVLNVGPVGTCVPYSGGVNCQTLSVGLSPTLDVNAAECVPH